MFWGGNACRGMPRIYDGTCFPPLFCEKTRAHAVGGMWPGALGYSRTTADGWNQRGLQSHPTATYRFTKAWLLLLAQRWCDHKVNCVMAKSKPKLDPLFFGFAIINLDLYLKGIPKRWQKVLLPIVPKTQHQNQTNCKMIKNIPVYRHRLVTRVTRFLI